MFIIIKAAMKPFWTSVADCCHSSEVSGFNLVLSHQQRWFGCVVLRLGSTSPSVHCSTCYKRFWRGRARLSTLLLPNSVYIKERGEGHGITIVLQPLSRNVSRSITSDPDMICIEDIAHALSLICRGNGQVKTFSVGQHCINCAQRSPCARIFQACGICLPSARCQRMLFIWCAKTIQENPLRI